MIFELDKVIKTDPDLVKFYTYTIFEKNYKLQTKPFFEVLQLLDKFKIEE